MPSRFWFISWCAERLDNRLASCRSDLIRPDCPESIAYAEGVFPDWRFGALAEGLACYEREEFFLAHEHWESVWLGLDEPEKSFLQALIQTSAAFHHLKGGNRAGAASLLRRAFRRLEACPGCFGGVAVTPLRSEISAWLCALENEAAPVPRSYPQIIPADRTTG